MPSSAAELTIRRREWGESLPAAGNSEPNAEPRRVLDGKCRDAPVHADLIGRKTAGAFRVT